MFDEHQTRQHHGERTIATKYTMGLPTAKFADLLIRLREEGVEGRPTGMGLRNALKAALICLRATMWCRVGDRRAAGCVPAHDLAGHQGHDRRDHPGPEGPAAHRGGGARGLRTTWWTAPSSPAGASAITANRGRGEHRTTGVSARILVLPSGRLVWASDPYPGSMHDVAAPDASGLLDGIDPFGWIADKRYIGRGMITPHKKPQRRAERGGEGGEQEHQPDPSDRKSGPSPTSSPGESTRTDYRRPLHNSSKPSPPHSHLSCTVWGGFVFWVGFFDGAGGVVVVGH